MILYLNCYVVGQGYTLKKAEMPGPSQKLVAQAISPSELPQKERELFLGNNAPLLFLGDGDAGRFCVVRNIPTPMKDENSREYFLNLAFSAVGEEAGLVDVLAQFAFCKRRRFQLLCESMIEYRERDHILNVGGFSRLVKLAQSDAKANGIPAGKGPLVTENAPEAFFQDPELGYAPGAFAQVISYEAWLRLGLNAELFFYCTTPATGFMLSQVDPATGEALGWGSDVEGRMLPSAWNVMTNAGAKLALLRQGGKLCLVVKDVKSSKAGPYGAKHMSFVLQVKEEQGILARQLGAWAVIDYPAFAEALTDCVQVSGVDYKVSGEKVSRLLDRFTEPVILPGTHPGRIVWQKVGNSNLPVPLLVLDATLEYFCKSSGIPLTARQIGVTISPQQKELMLQNPMALDFTPELYGIFPVAIQEVNPPQNTVVVKEEPIMPKAVETPAAVTPSAEPPEPKPAAKQAEEGSAAPPERERQPGPWKNPTQASTQATRPLQMESFPADEGIERVDLLQYRWFWPMVIGAAAVLAAVVILGIYWWGQHG